VDVMAVMVDVMAVMVDVMAVITAAASLQYRT